jgi:gamma-glutamyl-gamma-aminobutyrate hydrolase PuuD
VPPLVAITGRPLAADRVTRWRHDGVGLVRTYVDALRRAGAHEAVLFPSPLDPDEARQLIGRFDGLLLPGGADLDPSRYGAAPHPEVYGVNPEADDFELALVAAAIDAGVPVLAVCRGMQILNVASGGTLHQHIAGAEGLGDHGYPDVAGSDNHVRLAPGSGVARAMGGADVVGRCHHHQAVDRLGAGLVPVGWSDDGLVEAVERDDAWVLAVQWHPEETAAGDAAQQGLFDALCRAASASRA